jgi:hypothetical protein
LTQCLIMFVGDASDKCLYLGVALPLGGRVVGRRDDTNHSTSSSGSGSGGGGASQPPSTLRQP